MCALDSPVNVYGGDVYVCVACWAMLLDVVVCVGVPVCVFVVR